MRYAGTRVKNDRLNRTRQSHLGLIRRQANLREASRELAVRRLALVPVSGCGRAGCMCPGDRACPGCGGVFQQNCVSCHTIGGGRLTGPDLKGVTERRDHAWLLRYLPDPKALIDSGDPIATQLFQEARGVIMPPPPLLTPAMADALISMIEAESKLERLRTRTGPRRQPMKNGEITCASGRSSTATVGNTTGSSVVRTA